MNIFRGVGEAMQDIGRASGEYNIRVSEDRRKALEYLREEHLAELKERRADQRVADEYEYRAAEKNSDFEHEKTLKKMEIDADTGKWGAIDGGDEVFLINDKSGEKKSTGVRVREKPVNARGLGLVEMETGGVGIAKDDGSVIPLPGVVGRAGSSKNRGDNDVANRQKAYKEARGIIESAFGDIPEQVDIDDANAILANAGINERYVVEGEAGKRGGLFGYGEKPDTRRLVKKAQDDGGQDSGWQGEPPPPPSIDREAQMRILRDLDRRGTPTVEKSPPAPAPPPTKQQPPPSTKNELQTDGEQRNESKREPGTSLGAKQIASVRNAMSNKKKSNRAERLRNRIGQLERLMARDGSLNKWEEQELKEKKAELAQMGE